MAKNITQTTLIPNDWDAMSVRPSDYEAEVALGLREGAKIWNKFGYNADVDSAATEVIAEFGGTFTPLAAASTLTIVSADAADDAGSTGATAIVVYGVDANWNEQIEVITMDGVTPVVTTSTWLGVNRAAIYTAGTGQTNAGKITCTATTGGSIQFTMPAGQGTTQQCIFFVEADHTALARWLMINCLKLSGSSPKVTVKGWVYSAVSNAKYEVFRENLDTSVENTVQLIPSVSFVIGEKSVFWLEATTNTNDTEITARFSLIEVQS